MEISSYSRIHLMLWSSQSALDSALHRFPPRRCFPSPQLDQCCFRRAGARIVCLANRQRSTSRNQSLQVVDCASPVSWLSVSPTSGVPERRELTLSFPDLLRERGRVSYSLRAARNR